MQCFYKVVELVEPENAVFLQNCTSENVLVVAECLRQQRHWTVLSCHNMPPEYSTGSQ